MNITHTDIKKPHTNEGTGLSEMLVSFQPATAKQASFLNQDALADFIAWAALGKTQTTNIIWLDSNITITCGDGKGNILPTADTIGLVLVDHHGQPVSIASIAADGTVQLSDNSQPCAFVIGALNHDAPWWAVNNLEDGINLYHGLHEQGITASVLISIKPYQFNAMVRHFAEVKQVQVNTTLDQKTVLMDALSGINAQAVITYYAPIGEMLKRDTLLAEILAGHEADIIDLQAHAWGTPEPLGTPPSTPTPFPIEAWGDAHSLLRQTVERIAHHAQVPLAMASYCVLGALSHMGQIHVDAPMGDGQMPAGLYLVVEGESGSGKTQALQLSHYKIKAHERQQYDDYIKDLATWEADKSALKGSELKDFLVNEPKPHNPITMFSDATIEPVTDKFINGEMSNASWTTDEAAQFFNGHTMTGDTAGNALGVATMIHSTGSFSKTRSLKNAYANPKTHAYDVRLTMLLMAQRVVLEPALNNPLLEGQGFLARVLIACPASTQGSRVWNDPSRREQDRFSDPVLVAYWSRCQQLLDPAPSHQPITPTGAPKRQLMRWQDKQTEQTFYDYMQKIENEQAQGGMYEHFKSYASRMAENASRIAALMAFFDERQTISTADIKRAFMFADYSMAERMRYADATPTGTQNDSERLSNWLVSKAQGKNPAVLNRSLVYNGAPMPMRKNNRLLQSELDNLESMGHVRQEVEGRKKVIYINPKLFN